MSDDVQPQNGPVAQQSDPQPAPQPVRQSTQQPSLQQAPPPKKQGLFSHQNKPPQPQGAPQQGTGGPNPKAKKSFPVLPAAIAIIIILILAALLLGKGGISISAAPTAQSELYSALSSPKNQTAAAVVTLASQKLVSSSQFNVSYTGQANVQVKGGSFGDLSFQIPFKLTFEKYNNNSRTYFNATGIPFLGNITGYEINLANGTSYACSSLSGGLLANVSSNATGNRVTCQPSYSNPTSQYLSQLGSLQNSSATNTTVKVIGDETYKGQGCVLTHMSGKVAQGNTTAIYNVTTCLSGQYYVPLNLTAVASTEGNSSYNVSISLNEVSIGQPVTLAGISALPGPLSASINSSQNATPGTYPITTLNYSTPLPFVNGTTTCTPPYGNQDTNCLGFTLNQNRQASLTIETTNYNAYHISVGCEIDQYKGEFVNSGFPVYYAINSSTLNSQRAIVGAVNTSGTASLMENVPVSFSNLPCTAEGTVPSTLAAGSQVSGTIWFNYNSAPSGGFNETGILASFNTTIQ